ncbi:MAG: FecR domain-containing protein [Deltaproteobacteria bacterium]|nr:FecR domain-containing protein [Deltaproteobacteria bacterium]
MRTFIGASVALALLVAAGPASAESAAKVSQLVGEAQVLRQASKHMQGEAIAAKAPWKALKSGELVHEGDAVKTAAASRLELTVPDGSRVRLGASSQVVLSQGHFGKAGERKVTFTLWLGRVWAKVAKRMGGESSFEVKTHNAVAGVRGTSFAVMANADLSSVVKVYTGSVGVKSLVTAAAAAAPGTKARVRREVPGPERIDQRQWEEVVATAMKQVKVTSLGEIQPAEDFVDAGDDEAWAMWNQSQDAALQ